MNEFAFQGIISKIKKYSEASLPGMEAHQKMAPPHRFTTNYYLEREKDYRNAGVLILLFPDENKNVRIVLIERTGGDFVHANQISFPGGKAEIDDINFEATALRETYEEIGVNQEQIEIVGMLSSIYIPPSKFLVFPFIGVTDMAPKFILSENEVVQVLIPKLSDFKEDKNIMRGDFSSGRGTPIDTPYYFIDGKKIWGATAMMISELMTMICLK